MSKPYVYVTRLLPEHIIEPYSDELEIQMWPYEEQPVSIEKLEEESHRADGLLTMLTDKVDQGLVEKSKHLKIVANMAVGYDNIDVDAATKFDITVTNTPDVLTDTTADLTFGLLMATARRMVEANQYIKDGKWGPWSPLLLAGTDIHHKTIGIYGMGRIGEAVARRARGFDMKVLYHNRSRKTEAEEKLGAVYVEFNELLEQSDFVVCMAPLTDETHHIFDAEAFRNMKKEAVFINASRGATMNEDDLYHALEQKDIAGAGLDVFEQEPIGKDHPLLQLDQVVCLPHIGSATVETRHKMMKLCLDNLVRYFRGDSPLTKVN
ncbi:D-glycerate dehydrogenase [Halobacillus sp. BBL2006]|uniref:2-hydroxyacid dehydrogenase n=1 Tax=Halobacillus sp. BBL2006 TaxID=1543706 RepID=UPI00054307C0|nr:D-glycerate dehydrogenase [Halobacillus sp. BBL2006]KHE68696.1 2-ketogluconate reductase [Halobacillus sp. BBL2006]